MCLFFGLDVVEPKVRRAGDEEHDGGEEKRDPSDADLFLGGETVTEETTSAALSNFTLDALEQVRWRGAAGVHRVRSVDDLFELRVLDPELFVGEERCVESCTRFFVEFSVVGFTKELTCFVCSHAHDSRSMV